MLQAGTLRKRCRRTLVKVQGLGVIPYDESADNFNLADHFSNSSTKTQENSWLHLKPKPDTRIPIPSRSSARDGRPVRVTRDPLFHMEEGHPTNLIEDTFGEVYDEDNRRISQTSSSMIDSLSQPRPYLLSDSALSRIRQIIFVGMLIGSYPWKWNKQTMRVDRWRPELFACWRIFSWFTTLQTLVVMLYQIHSMVTQWSRDLESYRGMFAYFFAIYLSGITISYRFATYLYEDPIRQYINTLLDFNKCYVERYVLFVDKQSDYSTGRMVMHLAIPAAGCQILNSVLFFLITPNQPFYYTSKFSDPKPWYWLIPGTLQDVTVMGHLIIFYITTSWLTVAHTNSVEFWLRETHKGNESGFTREALRSTKLCVETYRALQILCTIFNDCLSPIAIPTMKATVGLGLISSAFLVIRSMNHYFVEEFPGILVYPFCVGNTAIMGFGCLSMGAEMYDIANSFISSWSRTKQKNFRRVLLSCPTLKVKVARFYFITTATTITFFKVITDYVIDTIITFP